MGPVPHQATGKGSGTLIGRGYRKPSESTFPPLEFPGVPEGAAPTARNLARSTSLLVSGMYLGGQSERPVKPSAQPTLVRTQHLPPPAKTPRWLRIFALAGRFCSVPWCVTLSRCRASCCGVHGRIADGCPCGLVGRSGQLRRSACAVTTVGAHRLSGAGGGLYAWRIVGGPGGAGTRPCSPRRQPLPGALHPGIDQPGDGGP